MTTPAAPRIPPGGFRELGIFGWLFCKLAARLEGVPQVHLFTTLGQHRRLFWSWLPFGALLLGFGKLPRRDTELVVLRVAHLRGCAYELQQHRRIAKRRGVDAETQARIFAGPAAEGLTERDRALLTAVDELVETRTVSEQGWQELANYLDRPQLIELVTLVGQYDALAATLNTLRVPLDYPE
ncbi:carboxymuconolactone decarboxylase family protein [Mycobacterium sp.]|uniref:carboxymuconolactone decarboxylase family protein n=1 Tax=Mycobacterium sp. TaxID=1785 RepID=UPI003C77800C